MHALPLEHSTLVSIAEEASLKVGKNASVASELVFPLVYLTLKKHLGQTEPVEPAPSPLQALQAAQVALDNCIMVMSRDLAGLELIQPELACSRAALAQVEAAIQELQ
jgi:hypothetical protein